MDENIFLFYKYTVNMSPQKTTLKDFRNKIVTKHVNKILMGKEQLLVSPVFSTEQNQIYIQPVFDFDGRRGGGILKAQDDAMRFCSNVKRYPHIYEVTPNGVHLVFLVAFNDCSIEEYRNLVKNIKFTTLDVLSSTRNVPIFRIGSYKQNHTIIPTSKLHIDLMNICKKLPKDIYTTEEWIKFWDMYLLPQEKISHIKFFKQLS